MGGLGIRRPLGKGLPGRQLLKEEAINRAFSVACAVWSLSSPNHPHGKNGLLGATKAQTHPKSLHVLVCKMDICRLRMREITIRLALSKHLLFTRHSFRCFLCTHSFHLPSSYVMEVVLVPSTNEETKAQGDVIMYLTVRMQQSWSKTPFLSTYRFYSTSNSLSCVSQAPRTDMLTTGCKIFCQEAGKGRRHMGPL